MDVEPFAYVATEHNDDTYDAEAVHPLGHTLSLNGQGHLPVKCDCPKQ